MRDLRSVQFSSPNALTAALDSHWRWTPALVAISASLLAGGATSAAASAILASALCGWLAITTFAASPNRLRAFLAANAVGLTAAITFFAFSAASALPLGAGHPFWREFGFAAGPASISPYRTWEGLAALLAPIASYAIGALAIRRSTDQRAVTRALLALAAILAATGLVQMYAGVGTHDRLKLSFSSANSAATLFGMLGVMALACLLHRAAQSGQINPLVRLFSAPVSGIVLLTCLVCLGLTASRAGVAAAGLGFIVLCLLATANWRARTIAAVVVLTLVALAFRLAGERMWRFDDDLEMRAVMARTQWEAFLDRPWFGHGLNTFHEINAMYATPETWPAVHNIGAAHNIYIQALAENGILGAALLACLFATPIVRAAIGATRSGKWRLMAAGALSASILALAHGAVDFGLQTPAIAALLAFCLGAFGKSQSARSEAGAA